VKVALFDGRFSEHCPAQRIANSAPSDYSETRQALHYRSALARSAVASR
jgi:hypothetical protein